MELVTTTDRLDELRGAMDHGCALVPTMGALHEGHLSLVTRGINSGLPVVVTIFVNPTQFAPGEDFERYPRMVEQDLDSLRTVGATVVFAPDVETVYPPGTDLQTPSLPAVASTPRLEDACRDGHFDGVVQVVARLFDLVRPTVAVFGEKDYQQLLVIRAIVAEAGDRWPGLVIDAHPTIRQPDGLALSSRNGYLQDDEREQALGLSRALQAAAAAQRPETAESLMRSTLESHGLEVEYAVVRDATTLMPVTSFERPTRGLIAARLGSVRLIDNRAMPVWS